MVDTEALQKRVIEALEQVIDPETGADVMRMRLVLNLKIHDNGTVEYVFRPSSPLCPIALTLVMDIIEAVKSVEGITDQKVTVIDYTGADELNAILSTLPSQNHLNFAQNSISIPISGLVSSLKHLKTD